MGIKWGESKQGHSEPRFLSDGNWALVIITVVYQRDIQFLYNPSFQTPTSPIHVLCTFLNIE